MIRLDNKFGLFLMIILGFFFGVFVFDLYLQGFVLRVIFFVYLLLCFWFYDFPFRFFLFFLIGVCFGVLRLYISIHSFDDVSVLKNYDVNEWRACVVDEVDVRFDKVNYILKYEESDVRILFKGARYPVYKYSDCLILSGQIEEAKDSEDFSYRRYLFRYGVSYVVFNGKIKGLDIDKSVVGLKSVLFSVIYDFKLFFEDRLNHVFSEPYSSFLSGLILGSRKGIPAHLLEDFQRTGLTHIIAISGYNITLLVIIVSNFLSFLSRRAKVVVSLLFIFLFVILVGMSAAVVRAAIMGSIGLFAVWFGRQYLVGLSLLLSAFFMSLWNPWILLVDVGFHLSFLATCGLIYVAPLIERFFVFLPESFSVRESAVMTMAAQILALPIILLHFNNLSVVSPLANIFVLPFIPFAMLFGFFAVVFSFVNFFLGQLFGFFAYVILSIVIFLVSFFSNFVFSYVEVSFVNWWLVIFYYLFWLWFFVRRNFRLKF